MDSKELREYLKSKRHQKFRQKSERQIDAMNKNSLKAQARYNDPVWKEQHTQSLKKSHTDTWLQNVRASAEKRKNDPKWQAEQEARNERLRSNKKLLKKYSDLMKQRDYNDPKWKEAHRKAAEGKKLPCEARKPNGEWIQFKGIKDMVADLGLPGSFRDHIPSDGSIYTYKTQAVKTEIKAPKGKWQVFTSGGEARKHFPGLHLDAIPSDSSVFTFTSKKSKYLGYSVRKTPVHSKHENWQFRRIIKNSGVKQDA